MKEKSTLKDVANNYLTHTNYFNCFSNNNCNNNDISGCND